MTEQEYLDSKNIVTEYVEDFTDRNGWKNISLTTLLKDYKQQLILTDVSQHRELLLAFAKYMEEDKMYARHDEANVDDFLDNYSN
jgi:hypothetical protein